MSEKKPYYSICQASKTEETIKKSVFLARAFPIEGADQAEEILEGIRFSEKDASHHPYAYVADIGGEEKKCSDDGEPQGTAGRPILETIDKRELTRVLLVVTRYFGGIKLGAPGLLRAYRSSANQALDQGGKALYLPARLIHLSFSYEFLGKIDYYLKEKKIKEISRSFDDRANLLWILAENLQERVKGDIMEITSGQGVWERGRESWVKKILDEGRDRPL